ncbi:hypothetical protein MN869_10120 [Acinetobacter sp. NIPH1876]|uniref:hypothetical protein n=1 Tax=Acinetobacter sp. NIPH1876 TaxID=2924041 RepID=UPI001FAB57BE|nr:hypothetical protein [Acinetobacter sp. NIPH1876]MCJ0828805.1 hypothetical protein [Acinetobacter sp. NIPH1876]
MQDVNMQIKPGEKLLEPMTTRVPIEVKQLIDDLADGNRAGWIREAIVLKLQIDLGQSSVEALKKAKNTTYSSEYMNVFKSIFSVFQTSKKPEVAIRAFGNVH